MVGAVMTLTGGWLLCYGARDRPECGTAIQLAKLLYYSVLRFVAWSLAQASVVPKGLDCIDTVQQLDVFLQRIQSRTPGIPSLGIGVGRRTLARRWLGTAR